MHLIPYAGPTLLVGVVTLVSYVQFDSLQPVLLLVAIVLALVGIVGMLIVPWLTQRVGHLNTVTVFIAQLFWGWLWVVWGLLLGVPIVISMNAVCERVAHLFCCQNKRKDLLRTIDSSVNYLIPMRFMLVKRANIFSVKIKKVLFQTCVQETALVAFLLDEF